MSEHSLQFVANPAHSKEVQERYAVIDKTAQRNKDAIVKRMKPHLAGYNARANAIINSSAPPVARMAAMWQLADEMYSHAKGNTACRKGCTHCCHLGVALSPVEAELVGARIGRKPAEVATSTDFQHFDYGYHNPCTFLKDGACSIYEHRPLVCRTQYSMDVDDLLCRLVPPGTPPPSVPYIDNTAMHQAEVYICFKDSPTVKLADIREWFPA